FFDNIEDLNKEDLGVFLKNYYRLNLNVRTEIDQDQTKKLLLNLPEELADDQIENIQRCIIGNLKRFKLDNFQDIENYKAVCDRKILAEFEKNDNVEEIRDLICEAKFDNIKNLKRDLYWYEKYCKKAASENSIVPLFKKFFKTEDKSELLDAYKELNKSTEEFELESLLKDIRDELNDISKQDVIEQMGKMRDTINNSEKVIKDDAKVIDLTGKNFNLLISTIASNGSPYIVRYINKWRGINRKREKNRILHYISLKNYELKIKLGIKVIKNKRYKLDPMKNKQRCTSSIDQNFLGHIPSMTIAGKEDDNGLILAYFPADKEQVSLMGSYDLMTSYDKDRKDKTRKRIVHRDNESDICNLKLQDLNSNTMGDDNEVVVDSYPGAIVCFDKVSDISKKVAKKRNIPIVYIDSKEQFKLMKKNLEEYYEELSTELQQNVDIPSEIFEKSFNMFDKNDNIIHRMFSLANSFTYLNEKDYPKDEIINGFENMKTMLRSFMKKANPKQLEIIKSSMAEEADWKLIRYGRFHKYIDYDELIHITKETKEDKDSR
ncbi:MAG: hypothetical protein HFJ17_05515, partial [Clostridia bacterium]|nr:hypothetical protein [Clostridia bacterium]